MSVILTSDIDFLFFFSSWLNKSNTYQTEIQSQAASLIISGHDIHIDAHQTGGIDGSGQVFWSYYFNPANNITKEDGDGRPIAFTIQHASNVVVKDFHI